MNWLKNIFRSKWVLVNMPIGCYDFYVWYNEDENMYKLDKDDKRENWLSLQQFIDHQTNLINHVTN